MNKGRKTNTKDEMKPPLPMPTEKQMREAYKKAKEKAKNGKRR